MGCCTKTSKYLLFIFNILFWIAGGALLGIGIYLRVKDDASSVVEFAGVTFYYAGCYIMISVGAAMFVMGFLGCCGAIKESRCLLGIYFACIFCIFVLELGFGIWALVNQDMIQTEIKRTLNSSTPLKYDEQDAYVQSVIAVETRFKCCGLVHGCTDWDQGKTYGCACNDLTSADCAVSSPSKCTNEEGGGAGLYTNNCYDAVNNMIMKNLTVVAGIGIAIGLMEIFGMVFVCIMCNDKKKDYSTY